MMKFTKLLLCLALAVCCSVGAMAEDDWTIFQLGFLPDVPSDTATVSTYGVKVGAPISTGAPVFGVEAGVFWAGSGEVTGFQGCLIAADAIKASGLQLAIVTFAELIEGVQLGVLNFVNDCCGVQLGVFNSARGKTFQIGILNYVEDSDLCPWLPIFNFKFK